MDAHLERFGSGAIVKRLGLLVDAMQLAIPDRNQRLANWAGRLTAGLAVLDPSSRRRPQRIATRWRVRVNVDETMLRRAT